ncbi:MAG: NUDIX hydrolase [Candidatus Nanohalobium sp.]
MSRRDLFRVVCTGIVEKDGKVLIGKKEEVEGHPISGEWHFPGGHMDHGETLEDAVEER